MVKTTILLDTRKIKKDGTYPIILRVYHQGKASTRSTKIYVNEKQRDDKKKLIKNCHSDSKALNERLLKDLANLQSGLIKSDDINEYLNPKQIKITAKVPKITVITFVTGLISEL